MNDDGLIRPSAGGMMAADEVHDLELVVNRAALDTPLKRFLNHIKIPSRRTLTTVATSSIATANHNQEESVTVSPSSFVLSSSHSSAPHSSDGGSPPDDVELGPQATPAPQQLVVISPDSTGANQHDVSLLTTADDAAAAGVTTEQRQGDSPASQVVVSPATEANISLLTTSDDAINTNTTPASQLIVSPATGGNNSLLQQAEAAEDVTANDATEPEASVVAEAAAAAPHPQPSIRSTAFSANLQTDHVTNSDPKEEAREIFQNKHVLDKTKLGEHLSRDPDYQGENWNHVAKQMDFANRKIDKALRLFLCAFRLPGEAQQIDRIMEAFAQSFTEQNPSVFPSADVAYVLSLAMIQLATDLQHPVIKKTEKMSQKGFIRGVRGSKEGHDLPTKQLRRIYNRIKADPIRVPVQEIEEAQQEQPRRKHIVRRALHKVHKRVVKRKRRGSRRPGQLKHRGGGQHVALVPSAPRRAVSPHLNEELSSPPTISDDVPRVDEKTQFPPQSTGESDREPAPLSAPWRQSAGNALSPVKANDTSTEEWMCILRRKDVKAGTPRRKSCTKRPSLVTIIEDDENGAGLGWEVPVRKSSSTGNSVKEILSSSTSSDAQASLITVLSTGTNVPPQHFLPKETQCLVHEPPGISYSEDEGVDKIDFQFQHLVVEKGNVQEQDEDTSSRPDADFSIERSATHMSLETTSVAADEPPDLAHKESDNSISEDDDNDDDSIDRLFQSIAAEKDNVQEQGEDSSSRPDPVPRIDAEIGIDRSDAQYTTPPEISFDQVQILPPPQDPPPLISEAPPQGFPPLVVDAEIVDSMVQEAERRQLAAGFRGATADESPTNTAAPRRRTLFQKIRNLFSRPRPNENVRVLLRDRFLARNRKSLKGRRNERPAEPSHSEPSNCREDEAVPDFKDQADPIPRAIRVDNEKRDESCRIVLQAQNEPQRRTNHQRQAQESCSDTVDAVVVDREKDTPYSRLFTERIPHARLRSVDAVLVSANDTTHVPENGAAVRHAEPARIAASRVDQRPEETRRAVDPEPESQRRVGGLTITVSPLSIGNPLVHRPDPEAQNLSVALPPERTDSDEMQGRWLDDVPQPTTPSSSEHGLAAMLREQVLNHGTISQASIGNPLVCRPDPEAQNLFVASPQERTDSDERQGSGLNGIPQPWPPSSSEQGLAAMLREQVLNDESLPCAKTRAADPPGSEPTEQSNSAPPVLLVGHVDSEIGAMRLQATHLYWSTLAAYISFQSSVEQLQASFRSRSLHAKFKTGRQSVVRLQAIYRRRSTQAVYRSFQSSVVQLQASFRSRAVQAQFKTGRQGVLRLQAVYRRCSTQAVYRSYQSSAAHIQASFRSRALQAQFKTGRQGVVRLQAVYRRCSAQAVYRSYQSSAVQIQAFFRSRVLHSRFIRRWQSVVRLQAAYRHWSSQAVYRSFQSSAVQIQAFFHSCVLHSRFIRRWQSAVCLQAAYRRWSSQAAYISFQSSAIHIQAFYRFSVAQAQLKVKRESSVRLQVAAVRLQAFCRNHVIRARLRHFKSRLKADALQEFFHGRDNYTTQRVIDMKLLLRGHVQICVWNPASQHFAFGSGFLFNVDLGLVVTAAHVVYGTERGKQQIGPYIFVGVVRDAECRCSAFQYLAQVVGRDHHYKDDVCILRIGVSLKKELRSGLDLSTPCRCGSLTLNGWDSAEAVKSLKEDGIQPLSTTTSFELGEYVTIFGFNQGDSGTVTRSCKVGVLCRSVNVSKGFIHKYKRGDDCINLDSSSGSDSDHDMISDEIVIIGSPVINGDSGGACINSKGEVIGILSRKSEADPTRYYLVPMERIIPPMDRVLSFLPAR